MDHVSGNEGDPRISTANAANAANAREYDGSPILPSEEARLSSLTSYDILDTPREDAYNEIVSLASEICETPIALISLVDRRRQWFKSVVGLDVSETPRGIAFCAHAILGDEVLAVTDATKDERFAGNPLVTDTPNIRFYAGMPIQSTDGYKLGTLCVIDRIPRVLTPFQQRALITLGRQVETQLALRKKVRELRAREVDLQRERDLLARTQRQKDELMTLIVHDLKSPLASLVPNVRFIFRDPGLSPDTYLAAIDIGEAAEAMSRLVMNLLDLSRSEDGSFTLTLASIDLASLLDDVRRSVLRRTQDNGIRIVARAAPNLSAIVGDRTVLRRVLENLVDNAIKHSPIDGEISLNARQTEEAIEMDVRDEGPGIPVEARSRIFEKYVQLDKERENAAHVGRGIGLTFCKIAIEAHGGSIDVEDNLPQGTVFRVRLPLLMDD
jgi:signal transduction histidine kinase